MKRKKTTDQVRERAIEVIDRELAHRHVVSSGEIQGGTAFGIAVSVLYWLVRNDD